MYWCCAVSHWIFLILSWNRLYALVEVSTGVISLMWKMLHFLSFPSWVVSTAVLSFSIPETVCSQIQVGPNVPFWWSFTESSWPIFQLLALVIFLFCTGLVLFSSSSFAWSLHIFLSPHTANQPGWCLTYLQ